jgi:hypothetical protein
MNAAKPKSPTKKPKLIRDSFSIPKTEYAAIDALKARAVSLGTTVKKSELLRAGLMALQGMGDAAFQRAVAAVPALKTGRPAAAADAKTAVAPVRRRPARKAAVGNVVKTAVESAPERLAKTAAAPAARKRAAVKKTVAPN